MDGHPNPKFITDSIPNFIFTFIFAFPQEEHFSSSDSEL